MIGKTLSHYKILEQIGAGGMGVVYRAHDARLGRDVALKLLPAETLGSESARRALENEARTASALNHPHICTIHDVGEAEGQFFVAMEFVEGKSLARLIPASGLPEEQVMRYGMQIADALAHAEQRGVVHRDLKSANVVVTPDGRAKVLDFGLAQRARKEELEEVTRSKVSLEAAGGIAGTLAYMAPEALRGEAADARSDIWALGVVLNEMAAGELPFQGATGYELSSAILREPPRLLPARLSAGLRAVIQRCLTKEPAQRYQRAGEVKAALEAIGSSTPTALETTGTASVVAARERRTHKIFWQSATIGSAGALALAALLLAFNVGGTRDRILGRAASPKIESIAVLPLENLSGDPSQEYFADGMTEALITELAQISGLKKVTSRTSVMQFKGTRKSLPQIAKELNVDAVVEGSVQRSSNRVGITVQLIEAATDRHLWAKPYERDLSDVLTLQREVARAIADEIRVELTPGEQARLARVRPISPEAHDAYFRGRYYWNQRTPQSLAKAAEYFAQGIAEDPSYALAYAGLADAYAMLGSPLAGTRPPSEVLPKAKAAARQALSIDAGVAEAHSSLIFLTLFFDWDWEQSEREFQQAIERNANYATAHHFYSFTLATSGRTDQALAEIKQAQQLDPLSPVINTLVGWPFYIARKHDQAIQEYRKALQANPDFYLAHFFLGLALEAKGMFAEAIEEFQWADTLSAGSPEMVAAKGHAYALSGKKGEAQKVLAQLSELSRHAYVSPCSVALIYVALGEKGRAMEWLEKAYQERAGWLVWLKMDPRFDSMRSDPRFQELVRRMRIPESAQR